MSDTFFSRMKDKMFTRSLEQSSNIVMPAGHNSIRAPHIIDGRNQSEGYLTGQLLVATQLISGSCFQKSVVYVFQHNDEGAMGLVINQPLEHVSFNSLLDSKSAEAATDIQIPVYFGGPVEKTRGFVLHSSDYFSETSLVRHGDIAITASSSILNDMAAGRGPKHSMLCVGYAGWQTGQLEGEIAENSWLTVPSTPALIFSTEDDLKWATTGKSLGVDMHFYSSTIGHA
jgi:putative transcriptional regulator